ncbi:MAG: signal recognition particle protein [Bdellovibrionales bacterium]|nr:signal recognition particle protein [Bdellovibrionales bacterium]
MFESLSDKLLDSLRKIRGQAKISEENIDLTLKEIRRHFLEADVNFKVVKEFLERVKAKALGEEVFKGVSPGQQFVKIVHEELIQILGGESESINVREKPSVVFLVGLQGAGKTTTSAKLALFIRQKLGKKPGLVPADIYRPAAIQQLHTLAKQNQISAFPTQAGMKPQEILEKAKKWANEEMIDVVLVDTAGRLQIDDQLMTELQDLKAIWKPTEILLVADAMLGQQSVNVAQGFNERLGLTGLILTKIDGDARGGAALSIRETTGIPIKFLGTGEKSNALEAFHPDRLAHRILDMGDVLSLVEKAQEVIDEKTAKESAKKVLKGDFSMEDFLSQIQMMKKMGGMESLLKMIPGMGQAMKQLKNMTPPDAEVRKIEAIIRSMTAQERRNHKVLNGSRRLRIAEGSGTEVKDVNRLVKQFEDSKKMMSQMMKMGRGKGGGRGGMPFPF